MRRQVLFALILGIVWLVSSPSRAADLRGRIEAMHAYSNDPFPARNIEVTLFSPREQRVIDQARTGSDGMYYFYRIPPGPYEIRVRGFRNEEAKIYPLTVSNDPRQDIRAILVRD